MANGYANNLSIDRINVNGNYEPSNCRWADKDTQNYNKRDTIKVTLGNTKKTLKDLEREYGISLTTLRSRYKKYIKGQMTIEELISTKKLINKPRQTLITLNGITKNLSEWERETGVSRKTIINRYNKGLRKYEELFKKSH